MNYQEELEKRKQKEQETLEERCKRLDRASCFFYEAHRQAGSGMLSCTSPEATEYFAIASVSVSLLQSIGEQKIEEMEKDYKNPNPLNVHPSTIRGSSLDSAYRAVREYFLDGKRVFPEDDYEQLGRTCHSVKNLYKSGRLLLHLQPVFEHPPQRFSDPPGTYYPGPF